MQGSTITKVIVVDVNGNQQTINVSGEARVEDKQVRRLLEEILINQQKMYELELDKR